VGMEDVVKWLSPALPVPLGQARSEVQGSGHVATERGSRSGYVATAGSSCG
jgi:hypothetical protein